MLPLKYQGYAIVMEEVPNEISLAFNISGCPHLCDGCHSKNLWEYKGDLLSKDIEQIIDGYKDYISCVCFLGGDQNIEELTRLCQLVKKKSLKVCIYSGEDNIDKFKKLISNNQLDYLKIGHYDKTLGGLDSRKTNQKMYQINYLNLKDITYMFQRR